MLPIQIHTVQVSLERFSSATITAAQACVLLSRNILVKIDTLRHLLSTLDARVQLHSHVALSCVSLYRCAMQCFAFIYGTAIASITLLLFERTDMSVCEEI